MSRFYVGQRVRIVRYDHPRAANLVGTETVILEIDNSDCPYKLAVIDALKRRHWWTDDSCIEPLTNPGQKSLTAQDICELPNLPDFQPKPRIAA